MHKPRSRTGSGSHPVRRLVDVFHRDPGGQARNKFVSTHFRYFGNALYGQPSPHSTTASPALSWASARDRRKSYPSPPDRQSALPAIDQHRRARRRRARITVAIAHRHHAETRIALADPGAAVADRLPALCSRTAIRLDVSDITGWQPKSPRWSDRPAATRHTE
jgi:hypothetical protein